MNIIYTIVIVVALFELIGIRVSLGQIAAAYVIWAKSIQDEAPGPTVTKEEAEEIKRV
jgi:hypothetical protein